MVGMVDRKGLFLEVAAVPVFKADVRNLHRPFFITITVNECAILLGNLFDELVHKIDIGGGVHPAGVFIKPLVDKKLPPGDRAVGVQALFADHVHLTAKIE